MLAIDTETTGLFPHKGCRAFIITACSESSKYIWKFPVNPFTREVTYNQETLDDFLDVVHQHEELIFHNGNFDIQVLDAIPSTLSIEYIFQKFDVHDTMVMAHVQRSDRKLGLKHLGVVVLGYPADDETALTSATQSARTKAEKLNWEIASSTNPHPSLIGTQDQIWRADYWVPALYAQKTGLPKNHPWRTVCDEYALNDAERTMGLYLVLKEMMTTKQKVAYNKERRLMKPILDTQKEKVTVIPEELSRARRHYTRKLKELQLSLRRQANKVDFKVSSPKDMANAIYGKFGFSVPPGKQGKKYPSTDKDVLSYLLKDCPTTGEIPPKYKFLVDVKNTRKTTTTLQYLENYTKHKNEANEIQAFIKQTGTGTGRISVENPNTTNVGKDDMDNPFTGKDQIFSFLGTDDPNEEAFKLRNVFGPQKGNIWVCIDYQKFQLLIFAVASNNKEMLEAFAKGEDPHAATGRKIFKKDNLSAVERTAAKNTNFGILFGAGPAKIEATCGIPGMYSMFLEAVPGAKKFLDEASAQAGRKGYVHTLGGRRLYVPRARKYAASCYIIQGTEAEVVKDAWVDINSYIYSEPDCTLRQIMMVHDELVFRSPSKDIPRKLIRTKDKKYYKAKESEVKHLVKVMDLMENAGNKLGIPAKVDADIVTTNWANKTELVISRNK